MNSGNKLNDDLLKWATSEMHFHSGSQRSSLQAEDLRSLCRGQVVDVWEFVINHVYSVQTVKKVKGNLKVQRRQQQRCKKPTSNSSTEIAELKERKYQLQSELRSVMTDITQLEKDSARVQDECSKTDAKYQASSKTISDIKCKGSILNTFSQQSLNLFTQYEEYVNRLDGKLKALSKNLNENEYLCQGERKLNANILQEEEHIDSFETPCSTTTRETCNFISTYLKDVLQGSFGLDQSEKVKDNKLHLWTKVETVLAEYPVKCIIQALIANTQKSALVLADKTLKINIRKDAANLRFKYESVGKPVLKDLSVDPSLLQSVHQLIEDGQNRHVQTFIETQRLLNDAYSTQQHLEQVKDKISSSLKHMYEDKPGDYQLALSLADSKIRLSVERTTLNCLLTEAEKLRESISKGIKNKELLTAKYKEIQDFKSLASRKQNMMTELVKQNNNARNRLESQKIDIHKYIVSSLSAHYVESQTLVTQLNGCVAAEVDKFAQMALPYLAFLWLDESNKCAIIDMSIDTGDSSRSLLALNHLHSLKLPSWKAPENILLHCMGLKDEIDSAQYVEFKDDEKHAITKRIIGLCDRVDHDDHEQIGSTLPNLQDRLKRSTDHLNKCLMVKDHVCVWWDLPAFSIVPWIKVDGYSTQQWKEKWMVLSAQIQQM